jgi:hypothetical protein
MKVVVEGCCHGELDQIYDVIGQLQEREGVTVDLLICCGDFQAVRDKTDLNSMAVPLKYREMGSFYKARVFFNALSKFLAARQILVLQRRKDGSSANDIHRRKSRSIQSSVGIELRRVGSSEDILPGPGWSGEIWWSQNSRTLRDLQGRRLQKRDV